MVVDSSPQARDQVRTIAFIYFTCAQADRSWDNRETVALYEFLERQAGDGLTREQVAGLSQEAYQRHQELADIDARIHEIESVVPVALAALDVGARVQILTDLLALSRVDGKVSRLEDFTIARVRHALQARPRPADAAPRDEEVRLLAFLFFTFADADGHWQSEETAALYDHLERHTGTAERERTIALAHAAYGTLLATPDTDARIAWLAERVPTVLAHRDTAARKQILKELVELARADGKFSPAEGHTLEKIRELLLDPATLGTAD